MQNSKRGKFDVPLPSTLVYCTALTCSVLAAIALEIELSHAGYELIGLWGNLSSLRALQLRTAGPWWAIPVLAFIVGGITAAALSRLPLPWRRFRLLRWALAAALVFVLADIGHHAAGLPGSQGGPNVIASLAALGIAAIMALGGAYLTVRR